MPWISDVSVDYKGLFYINRPLMATLSLSKSTRQRMYMAVGARNSHPFGTVLSRP